MSVKVRNLFEALLNSADDFLTFYKNKKSKKSFEENKKKLLNQI